MIPLHLKYSYLYYTQHCLNIEKKTLERGPFAIMLFNFFFFVINTLGKELSFI